jgi:hypothetical protein
MDCPPPPVITESHAICLARNFVENPKPSLALSYEVSEREGHWLVYYRPTASNVRGGAGDLQIEKISGNVKFVKGHQ